MLIASAVALHLAAIAVFWLYFEGWRMAAGLAALAFSLLYALYAGCGFGRDSVVRISIDAKGRAALLMRRNQTAFEAVLLPGSMVHRAVCFLHWRVGGRVIRQCLPADAAGRQAYRRLTIWARYGQPKHKDGL